MKSYSDPAMDAIIRGEAIVTGAVAILSDPPVRVWGGPGPLSIDGEDFLGVGDRGLVKQSAGALGGAAQGLTLDLSGIEPAHLELLEADEVRDAPAIVWRLIFAADGKTKLDHHIFDRGRVDQLMTIEVVGGEAAIRVMLEGAGRGLGRSGGRMRSDADQRLIAATDGYFKQTGYAPNKLLYWGGRRPSTAGTALGGGGRGSGGGNVTTVFWNDDVMMR